MNNVKLASRRGFLKGVFSAGALVLTTRLLPAELADGNSSAAAWQPSVYLGIEPDGTVIIVAHRSEMGTGNRTSLPMVVADELEADWSRVKVQQADGDKKYGDQNTDGSHSVRSFYAPLREAGATARWMLEHAAAEQWNVPAEECHAQNHQVVHKGSNRRLGFGELVAAASKQTVPGKQDLHLKTPAEFRYIGKSLPIVDLDDICTGRAVFGIDVHRPGMVYASIERSPVLGGTLKSVDDRAARQVPGVQQTVTIDAAKPPYGFQALGGVAVIADNSWAAMQGRKKLQITWDPGPNAGFDSPSFKQSLIDTVHQPQKPVRNLGDVDAQFAAGGAIHEATYYVPHLAHAPMEPPAAVADYRDGKAVVWACTQNPQATQDTVASALGIDSKNVTCHVTLLGGGFGRKSKPDYVAEAAILSKKLGKPVKVVWSREDDIHYDYFNAVAGVYLKAATDPQGRPTAWLGRSAFTPIPSTFDASVRYGSDGELGQGWLDVPFEIANFRAENGPAQNHVRIGWLRSVANIYHAFAVQTFLDELAAAAKRDRVEYMLEVLGPPRKIDLASQSAKYPNYGASLDEYPVDTGRLRRVIELVAQRSGWSANRKPEKGRGFGIAAHRSFLTYVAAVVEVQVDDQGKLRIPEVHLAVDAGRVVHPERTIAQFEGAAVFGTSIALMSEITAAKGQVQQSNFHDYRVARINEAPARVHVHLVESEELPAGVGEPGVPPVAPAICNAIFAATGTRIRELPIGKQKLV